MPFPSAFRVPPTIFVLSSLPSATQFPSLCLVTILFSLFSWGYAQPTYNPVPLSFYDEYRQIIPLQKPLQIGESINYTFDYNRFPDQGDNRTNLFVQFISTPEEANTRAEGFPDIILYAANSFNQSLIVDESISCNCSHSTSCQCSDFYPCFENNENTSVDTIAFSTHSSLAFVNFYISNLTSSPVFGVINYNRGRRTGNQNSGKLLAPVLNGSFIIRLVNESNKNCPLLPQDLTSPSIARLEDDICGMGICTKGQCNCQGDQHYFYGRFCEHPLFQWTSEDDVQFHDTNTINGTFEQGDRPYLNLSIQINNTAVIKVAPPSDGNPQSLFHVYTNDKRVLERVPSILLLVAVAPNVSHLRKCTELDIDSLGLRNVKSWTVTEEKGGSLKLCLSNTEKPNSTQYLSIYANGSVISDTHTLNVRVYISELTERSDDACSDAGRLDVFPIEVLPIILVIIILASGTIFIMLWLDRQHGFTHQIDLLSINELNRMYPVKRFRSINNTTDVNACANTTMPRGQALHIEDTSPVQCPICICPFEEEEEVRILQCNHEYHAECIDVSFRTA